MRIVNFYVKPPEKDPATGQYLPHRLAAARPIYMYVMSEYKSQRAVHSTGLKVKHNIEDLRKSHWDEESQRVKPKAPGASEINRELERLERIAKAALDDLKAEKQRAADEAGQKKRAPVRKNEIKKELKRRTRKDDLNPQAMTLKRFILQHAQVLAEDSKSKGTSSWRVYSNVAYHFENFCSAEYCPNFNEVGLQFFEDFRDYLRRQPARKNKHAVSENTLSDPYIGKIISTFFTMLRYARKKKYTSNRDFEGIRLKEDLKINRRKLVEGVYLTFEEIRRLYHTDVSQLEPMAETVRDIFVAACLHGQRHSDWDKVNQESGRIGTVGEFEFVEVVTQKGQGDKIAYVPVYSFVAEVLKKYGDKMPKVPLGTVNRLIKEVAQVASIDREVNYKGELAPIWQQMTSHVARKSFVSNFRDIGTPDQFINLVTTHGKKNITDNYDRRTLKKKARELVPYLRKVEKELEEKEATVRKLA